VSFSLGRDSHIAFHGSASGTGRPINNGPGAATEDSDIFVANVDDLLEHGTPLNPPAKCWASTSACCGSRPTSDDEAAEGFRASLVTQ
jgi:hypothetical protein